MINKIAGKAIKKEADDTLILKTSFLEFKLISTLYTVEKVKLNEEVNLFTYLHVREDELKLFAFLEEEEREVFLSLLKVEGIGVKAAIKILSSLYYKDFKKAIEEENLNLMTSVKGISKKTAQKIFLKLKDKLLDSTEGKKIHSYKEIVDSLLSMGYDKKLINLKIEELVKSSEFLNIESREEREKFLFRELLKRLY